MYGTSVLASVSCARVRDSGRPCVWRGRADARGRVPWGASCSTSVLRMPAVCAGVPRWECARVHLGRGGGFVQVRGEGLCVPRRLQGETAGHAFKPHVAAGVWAPCSTLGRHGGPGAGGQSRVRPGPHGRRSEWNGAGVCEAASAQCSLWPKLHVNSSCSCLTCFLGMVAASGPPGALTDPTREQRASPAQPSVCTAKEPVEPGVAPRPACLRRPWTDMAGRMSERDRHGPLSPPAPHWLQATLCLGSACPSPMPAVFTPWSGWAVSPHPP